MVGDSALVTVSGLRDDRDRARPITVNVANVLESRAPQWAHVFLDERERSTKIGNLRTVSKKQRTRISRTLQYWTRVMSIYASYKVCQLRVQFVKDEKEKERVWEDQHEKAADKIFALCSELGGFFLKTAQVLAKPDLTPKAWVKKLVVLCDAAPPTPHDLVKDVIETELGKPMHAVFESFDVKPVGSASIAQVHRARLRGSGADVAVKVQHPGIEELMMTDIQNQKAFAAFLERFDVKFDLMSAVTELEVQVRHEFDFIREAKSMDRIAESLAVANHGKPPVQIPRSINGMVTRRVLVMDFMEGIPILQMPEEMSKRGINPNGTLVKQAKRRILRDLTSVYGQMILRDGFFQADPHPGNVLIDRHGKVILLDFGQVKELPKLLRLTFAKLILGIASKNVSEIKEAFQELNIVTVKKKEDGESVLQDLATVMFDTKLPNGMSMVNLFTADALVSKLTVQKLPQDLFFVLRAIHILRGLSYAMGVSYSAAEEWKGYAKEALEAEGNCKSKTNSKSIGKNAHTRNQLIWEGRKRARRLPWLQPLQKNVYCD